MKVAILIDERDEARAFGVIVSALARSLRAAGDEAILIRNRADREAPLRTTRHGVRCYQVGLLTSPLHRRRAASQIGGILRQEGCSCLHFHFSGSDYFGFSDLAERLDIPYLATLHAFEGAELAARPQALARCGLILRRARATTAVSGFVAAAVARSFPRLAGRVKVVANGAAPPRAAASRPRGLPRTFILSAGTLCFQKGTDLLLFAFHDLLPDLLPSVKLVLCGDDPTGRFSRMIAGLGLEKRVLRLGPLPHDQVLAAMERCLFYVCASRRESFGMALAEAMACGKAAAAAKVGGVREYLHDGRNGLAFRPGDVTALAGAMRRLAEDGALRARLGARARGIGTRFSWPAACSAYRRLYHECAAA